MGASDVARSCTALALPVASRLVAVDSTCTEDRRAQEDSVATPPRDLDVYLQVGIRFRLRVVHNLDLQTELGCDLVQELNRRQEPFLAGDGGVGSKVSCADQPIVELRFDS